MNKLRFTSIFALLLPLFLFAQEEGVIVVHEDASVTENINANRLKKDTSKDAVILAKGYRVQVYSDNHPNKAKQRTFDVKKEIEEDFPENKIYISFDAPFWKLHMGNFASYHEALLFSRLLKKELKKLENGIYIVQEEVEVVSIKKPTNQATEETKLLSTDSIPSTNTNQYEL